MQVATLKPQQQLNKINNAMFFTNTKAETLNFTIKSYEENGKQLEMRPIN